MAMRITVIGENGFKGPMVKADALEALGSLLLIEPGHQLSSMSSSTPLDGSLIENILYKKASLNGILNSSSLFSNTGLDSQKGIIERTQKGGIHGIVSQVNLVDQVGAKITLSDDVVQYLIDNPDNEIYISTWMTSTREGVNQQPARVLIGAAENNKMLTYFYKTGIRPSSVKRIDVENSSFADVVGQPIHQAISVSGWTENEVPATPSEIDRSIKWGAVGGVNSGPGHLDSMPSFVFYRMYIEDLTVSGRSHNDVFQIENEEFGKAFGVGGRYFNDTYTDVSLID